MIFSSDIVYREDSAAIFNIVKMYFQEADNIDNEEIEIDQINYKVLTLCTYLGLALANDDISIAVELREDDDRTSFNVPRIVLTQHTTDIKELLICAKFVKNKYIVNDEELQIIWNQKNYLDDEDLARFVKECALTGAKYITSLVRRDIQCTVYRIAQEIDEKIFEFKERVSNAKIEYSFSADLADMEI